MPGTAAEPESPRGGSASEAALRDLAEQLERAQDAIESLVNRTNTLVHLLDILNKRVDRLESQK